MFLFRDQMSIEFVVGGQTIVLESVFRCGVIIV